MTVSKRIDSLLHYARSLPISYERIGYAGTIETPIRELIDRAVKIGETLADARLERAQLVTYEMQDQYQTLIAETRIELVSALATELSRLVGSIASDGASLPSVAPPLLDAEERSAIADAVRSLGISGRATPGPLEAIAMALGAPGEDASLATTSEASCYAVQRCADALETIAEVMRARAP